jgi:hypothetical protein
MAATPAGEVGVILHLSEHLLDVAEPQLLVTRSLVFSEDVKLPQCNLNPLNRPAERRHRTKTKSR